MTDAKDLRQFAKDRPTYWEDLQSWALYAEDELLGAADTIEAQAAEIERLRVALQIIADADANPTDFAAWVKRSAAHALTPTHAAVAGKESGNEPPRDLLYATVKMQEREAERVDRVVAGLEQIRAAAEIGKSRGGE